MENKTIKIAEENQGTWTWTGKEPPNTVLDKSHREPWEAQK